MKNLSKEKRNQLILVVLVFGGLLGCWYAMIYKSQTASLAALRVQRSAAEQKLHQVKMAIDAAGQVESQLTEAKEQLEKIEDGMASGDLYSWAINTLRQFKAGYKLDIPQYSQIDGPKPVTMLADFPYKQASLTVGGSARFYDFGKFISDFENQYPYMRILNLSLEPVSGLVASEKDKLAFRMEVVALVKPGAS